MAVHYRQRIVFLHTHLNNLAARRLVEDRAIPGLREFAVAGTEVTVGDHRFDLLLRDNAADLYLEVKSCTLSANGIAMFPDAVTERGRRHLLALAQMKAEGKRGALMFLVHHGDARAFLPDYHTDFAFARAFCEVEDRLPVLAVALEWTPDLRFRVSNPRVIIPWDTVRTECVDRGHLVCVARDGTGYRVSLTRYSDELSRKAGKGAATGASTGAGTGIGTGPTGSGIPRPVFHRRIRRVWRACFQGFMETRQKTPTAGRSGVQPTRYLRPSFKKRSWTSACRAGCGWVRTETGLRQSRISSEQLQHIR